MRASRRLLAAGLACLALTAACSAHQAKPNRQPSGPASGATGNASDYRNPVFAGSFPDPAVVRTGATFVAYATQGAGHNIQTMTSPDLVSWRPGPDALPDLPSWAIGDTWAPEVLYVHGSYVMFFVAHDADSGRQCIGRATASAATGPFRDTRAKPFICQAEFGGSIDPNFFRAPDGRLFLYWKNDGNCCGQATHLYGQRLSADASALVGQPISLLGVEQAWQGKLIEAPEMLPHGGTYLLFYSANDYASEHYALGYAICTTALGPCRNASTTAAWLGSSPAAAGPGHCYPLTLPNGTTWLLLHAWPPDAIGSQSPGRQLWLEPVTWAGTTPVIAALRTDPQPRPSVS